jgi:hypothetical protein
MNAASPRGALSDSLDIACIDFDGRRAQNEINGENDSKDVFLADKNSVNSCEGARFDSDSMANREIRVRFDTQSLCYTGAKGVHLPVGQDRWVTAKPHQPDYARNL